MSPNKIKIISYALLAYGIFGLMGIISYPSAFLTIGDHDSEGNIWTTADVDHVTILGNIISISYAVGPLIPGLLLLKKYKNKTSK